MAKFKSSKRYGTKDTQDEWVSEVQQVSDLNEVVKGNINYVVPNIKSYGKEFTRIPDYEANCYWVKVDNRIFSQYHQNKVESGKVSIVPIQRHAFKRLSESGILMSLYPKMEILHDGDKYVKQLEEQEEQEDESTGSY